MAILEPLADDILYLKILISSFLAAFIVKRLPCPYRDVVSGFFGLFLVAVVCRLHLLYSLVVVLINLICIRLIADPKKLPPVSFILTFAYLLFFRCATFFSLPKPYRHANAVQLLMTLRCIGLCFEISDAKMSKKNESYDKKENVNDPEKLHIAVPTTWQAFLYLFNFAGLFTGPYYSYQLHHDCVSNEHLLRIPFGHEILPRLMLLLLFIPILLVVSTFYPLSYVTSPTFFADNNLIIRFLFMAPLFVFLRMRVYCAWTLSEAACIAVGIGAYPEMCRPKCGLGPTQPTPYYESKTGQPVDKWSFEAIRNLDIAQVELSPGFRSGMRAWNRTVQYWLATYVYKRSPKTIRMPLTMLVSAFWHGIHPGYYLSFMTIPLCTRAEDLIFSIFNKKDDDKKSADDKANEKSNYGKNAKIFNLIWWLVKMRSFEYMAVGFLLLSYDNTIRYWSSLYFCVHLFMLTVIGCVLIRNRFFVKAKV